MPAEIRRLLGAKAWNKLVFEATEHGIKVVRQRDENRFENYRRIGNGIPELDGSREEMVPYMRKMRGYDEHDDLIFGSEW